MENYEQKHKEDLEAAKGWYKIAKDQNNQLAVEILETQFPELEESEDDRIRKAIFKSLSKKDARNVLLENGIQVSDALAWIKNQGHDGKKWIYEDAYLKEKEQIFQDGIDEVLENPQKYGLEKKGEKSNISQDTEDDLRRQSTIQVLEYARSLDAYNQYGKESIDRDIAWLEKKGEKVDAIENFDTEFEKQVSHLIASAINKEHEYNQGYVKWAANALLNYAKHEIEKQGEQKPTDKVKPKFKVGDWIVQPREDKPDYLWHIDRIKDDCYWYDKISAGIKIAYADNECHLWTIQDAKDGDVLASTDWVCIFKRMKPHHYNLFDSYCELLSCKDFGLGFDFNIQGFYPATKEQRNLLFQKMKEAGYEWDAEKKELKKIEQSCYHNDGLYYAIDILEKTLGKVEGYQSDDGIIEHQTAIETVNALYHKKPAWGEEDEEMFDAIECLTKQGRHLEGEHINWLKSLKDKIQPQPKQEWSEKDEKFVVDTMSFLYRVKDQYAQSARLEECLVWLKSLKDRIQPKQESEWNEEDEKTIDEAVEKLEKYAECVQGGNSKRYVLDLASRVESLRHQKKQEWSEEDIRNIQDIDSILFYDRRLPEDTRMRLRNWLKSLKDRIQP